MLTRLLQMSDELKRKLPRMVVFHQELGWLLQDLVLLAHSHFGQFWNEARPWENYRCKMSDELKRKLPRMVFFHQDLGWSNHQTYYEVAMNMQVDFAFARLLYLSSSKAILKYSSTLLFLCP